MQKDLLPVISNKDLPKKGRFPKWLHRSLPKGGGLFQTNAILEKYRMNTVCEEAKCPNRFSCYGKKTATFLALGKSCTRSCGFCDIDFQKNPKPLEDDEPLRIALSVKELNLQHVVITMVARDDLLDGGSLQIAKILEKIKEINPHVSLEVLTSDFSGDEKAIGTVLEKRPEIFNHNIETVPRLSKRIRHKASYERSLKTLEIAQNLHKAKFIKSGLMVGLKEEKEEVFGTLKDLRSLGVQIVTIGQYLQPSKKKLRVQEFVHPSIFEEYKEYGQSIGIKYVYSAPFVRSSLNAKEVHDILSKNS